MISLLPPSRKADKKLGKIGVNMNTVAPNDASTLCFFWILEWPDLDFPFEIGWLLGSGEGLQLSLWPPGNDYAMGWLLRNLSIIDDSSIYLNLFSMNEQLRMLHLIWIRFALSPSKLTLTLCNRYQGNRNHEANYFRFYIHLSQYYLNNNWIVTNPVWKLATTTINKNNVSSRSGRLSYSALPWWQSVVHWCESQFGHWPTRSMCWLRHRIPSENRLQLGKVTNEGLCSREGMSTEYSVQWGYSLYEK